MASSLSLRGIHHIRLTVTDVERSRHFYTRVLGFEVAAGELPPPDDPNYEVLAYNLQGGIVLSQGELTLGLRPADAEHAAGDSFNPMRVGLDHLSFAMTDPAELERAAAALDELGVEHSEVTEIPPMGLVVLPVKDPDGIQLELTAPTG